MTRRLTLAEAMALSESLEVSPETIATNGQSGEVQFFIPNFGVEDAQAYIEVITDGIKPPAGSITINSDVVEGSDLPAVHIIIKTEN